MPILDAEGAEALRWQLEQQANWRQAPAVRDGRQPAVDPDRDELTRVTDGLRVYTTRPVRGELVQLSKCLVDGVWITRARPVGAAEHAR
jgi:hypothetical protein